MTKYTGQEGTIQCSFCDNVSYTSKITLRGNKFYYCDECIRIH